MTFIKVCGLRDDDAVRAAVHAGADAVGFVFADSVRRVTPEQASALVAQVPAPVRAIGVFKGQSVEEIIASAHAAGLREVQVHDLTTAEQVDRLHAAGLRVIRAVVAGPDTEELLGADELLVDGSTAGSGEQWDWDSVRPAAPSWILAGGLDAGNVTEALARTGASGVDVSSGVERSRGEKDPTMIEAFVATVRAAR